MRERERVAPLYCRIKYYSSAIRGARHLTAGWAATIKPSFYFLELCMAKKMKKIPMSEKKAKARQKQDDAWISMRSGLIVITVLSVGLAVLTAWTTVPALGWFEGLLWGLGFGIAVWLVFIGFLYFNLWVRAKRD